MSQLALLLERFDGLIETPADVEKLEQAILQWAVMGRLVPQDPHDEPASVLLERIAAEKARLVKEGKIRKGKKLGKISAEDYPYNLPNSWQWVRTERVSTHIIDCPHSTAKFIDSGELYCIDTTNISQGVIHYDKLRRVSPETFVERIRRLKPEAGDILFSREGTIGQSIIVPPNLEVCLGQRMMMYRVSKTIIPEYFRLAIVSPMFVEQWSSKLKGTAARHVNMKALRTMLVPLPPADEQKRIVAKVDALFAQTRALKARLETAGTVRDRLQGAAVGRLSGAQSPDETQAAWRQVEAMFDHIHTTPEHIDSLKQTILQLAVMGRLVPQDPNDEPASVLLERIAAEKARLVKEGKIRKGKKLGKISAEERPFTIPESWQWERMGNLCHVVTDGAHHTPKYVDEGVPFLSVKDVSSGYLDFSNTRFITREQHETLIQRCYPEFRDILLTKVGTTGIAVIVDTQDEFSIFVSVALLKFNQEELYPEYLVALINSPLVKAKSAKNTRGVGNKNLVLRDIKNFVLPIPPQEEQKRIVAKVDELLALCDRVAAGLVSAEAARTQLLDAVLAQS
ncbi:MAG: restriction endonuclease subunit S [Anaerolineae bacterium]|nr:restriction endonuclease subunit S [Anaerolineae bacterium]MCO5194429.1 restriction endonuclease subunit S [Anaerolineae bacterium]MCO5199259.1 restriction endonuclease subunit S [Anaerolineae bacterium]